MPESSEPIRPDDIEAKFREIADDVDVVAADARSYALTAGVLALVVIAVLAFLLGRRRGARSATVVEVRRV